MSYQQAIFLETHKTKAHYYNPYKPTLTTKLKEKTKAYLLMLLTGLMLKTYMTLSYLWLFAYKIKQIRKPNLTPTSMVLRHEKSLSHAA